MPNPLDTLYDQLKGQYPDLVDRSEFIGKLSNEDELKKLHDAASKDIPGFVDFDNFKSKVGESLSTYDQDSDYKAQSAPAEQESAPTDITIPRREKGRHVPSEPQNGGISSEAYVPTEPGQPIDTRVDAEPFDRETGDLDELDRRYQEKVKRLEGYGADQGLYVNEDEARKHYEAYSRLYDEAEQDRLVYNRRVKAAEDERAEQQRQLDLQSKDRKTRRSAEYGGYTNDQVRKEQERLKKERAYLENPKSRRNADYSKRVMEYNADQTALSGEADKRNKRAESERAMYDEVRKVAEDPDVQKRITGNDIVAYVLSGNNPSALQNINLASKRAKTMSIEELTDTCKNIAGQKYARGDNKDIYAPLAAAFMAYHNELMYRLGGDEPKSALEMRYDMIDKATESSPEGDNFMLTLRNYLDGTAGMGTANFENDQSERANIPQFAVVDYFNNLLAQKEAENRENVERIAHSPDADDFKGMEMARAALDINYDAILQQAFDKFGDINYKAYITAHSLRNGISIGESARRVNQFIWNETIGKEMEESRPKSNAEFFLRRITSDNMFAKLWQIGLRAQNGTLGSTDPFMVSNMALDEYAKDHPGWDTAAVVTNFTVMEGPIFSAYVKAASGLVGAGERAIIGAATKTAERTAIESSVRALNQSFWYRLAKGVPTGGLVGFQYGTMSGAIDQAYYDGNVNFGKVIAGGLHMGRDFAIMHGVGEVFGVTGDAILRRGQRAFRNGQGKFLNRLETASLDFLNNVAKTTTNAAVVTGLYAAIDKPALERENKKIEAENKKIEAENARLPEDKQKPLKPLNQIASVEDTFYSSLRMFAGLDAVGAIRRAWSIGARGQYERNKHVKVHFDKFDKEELEKAFGKNPNSLLRQIVFGNVDGVPAKWFEIDPEAEAEIYKELGRELTPAEKEAYATYGFTELRKVILNKDIPWATRAKIVSVVTGRIVQEPPVARGTIEFVMDKSGTVAKRIIVKSLDLEGNVIQAREFDGQREFEAARSLYESLNDRGWRNNALLCGNLVIDAIEDKTYADTVDEMAREKGIAPEQFEQMVFGIKQKDITGEKVTYQERQLVDEFDKRHQQKQQAETELAGPNKLFEQVAREVFGAEWKRALNIPRKSWGEMSEAEKDFVNRYIDRIGAMGVAERNKLMNANPDWARTAKEYEESVRRRMAEAERPAEAEPLPALEDEKVSVETPAEERVEPVPEVIELEEETPAQEQPTQSAGPQDTPTPAEERHAEPAKPVEEEKPQQAGMIGFEPVEQPTERERYDAERKAKAATITDSDIEANREALGIPEGTALTDEARQIYAEDLAEDLMRYERFKRGESDEKARFHDYWENKFNPKRPKLENPVDKQEEPVEEEKLEEEEVTDADALIERLDNLKGRSDLEKYRNALTVFAGDDEIMGILEDLEPHDITEWVSSFLGLDSGKGYSMLWESKTRGGTVIARGFKEETGWSWNDVKGFAFMFDNKNGMSPRRVAEKIWEALPSGMKNQYSDVDVFNIMMDLFKSSSRKSDLTNYIRNNRMEQVRELLNRRRSEELADIARYKERERRGDEEPIAEPVTPDESDNYFAVREDDVAPFSLLSLNYRQGEVEGGTIRSRARTRKQIGTIAKALGYKIRWVADKPYNAKIDTDEKVLYLNIRTDQPLAAVMGHEVTHDLRKSDPKAYETLKRYAKDLLGQEQWDNEVKDVTDVYNEEYKRRGWEPIRADKAEEEVVCDTMGKLLHSRNGLRELAGSLDPGVAGKVYRLMKDITDKIKSALGKEHDYGPMDSAMQEFLESVEQRAKKGMPIQDAPVEEAPDDFSLRRKPAPKNTGVGYKVFFLKDGKLYPPMVANIGGEATPFGVWLDADAAPIAGKSKTGRNKVKAGGKGTQGGSGTLAYRPGWHLGKIPYALQFNRGKKVPNPLGILNKKGQVIEVGEFFPNDFVWAEVEYAADKDYQEEAHGYGVNANGKYNPSLAGLPRVPEDGSYEYRTNPNPATDPWIITGAMKVNKILKPSEVDEMVRAAGREPQKRQEGAFTDEQIDALNKQLNNTPKTSFSLKRDDRYAPTFYSNAAKAVENVKQNKATAEQWKAMLTKQGGIKAGEDKWMGLSTWLDEHKGETLTKDQVLEFVRQNGVQMEEVGYSEAPDTFESLKREYDQWLHDEGFDYAQEQLRERFGDDADIAFDDLGGELVVANEEAAAAVLGSENIINSTRLDYTTEGLENKREIAFVVPDVEPYQESDEIHFGPENQGRAVMWVRFGETRDANGKRVLVIDEIQSNRHQDAREKGYEDPALTERLKQIQQEIDAATKEFGDFNDTLRQKYGFSTNYTKIEKTREEWGWNHRLVPNEDVLTKEEVQKWKEGDEKIKALKDVKDKLLVDRMRQEGVPAAPFEKNWHEVAMKRMLRLAAEEGFDKVAWTTGGQQAERYDIGNAIERIEKLDDRTFLVYPKDGSPYQELEFDEDGVYRDDDDALLNNKTMADIFGKETAEKLKNLSDGDQLTGEGLRIGGEGMKGFYDQMLPQFMNKYGKRWGVKTGEVTLDTPGRETMHSVDVTPEMRRSVMEQGQPLFSLKRDEERTLMGVHNITSDKLRSALKLGGLANPSMAVIDTNIGGFDNFGEISLIPASDLIASGTGRNAGTWGADAYSPRFPETHRRLGKGGDKKMRAWAKGLGMRKEMVFNTEEQFNDYYNGFNIRDNALVYPFLHEKGLSGEVDYYTHKNVDSRLEDDLREANGDAFVLLKRFDEDEEYKKKLTDIVVGDEVGKIRKKDGESFQEFRDRRREWAKEIREALTEEDGFVSRHLADDLLYSQARAYRENGKFNEGRTLINAEEYIRDNGLQEEYQQYFEQKMQELGAETQVYAGSDSQGRSKFKSVSLDQVSRMMKKQGRAGGEGGIFEDSPGAIRAKLLNPMKTLDQIRKEKGRIVDHEQFEQAREEYQDELREYADRYARGGIGALADIITSRNMANTAKRYNIDLDADAVADLNRFKEYVRKLPTEYFETKFERPVGLEEFKKAVVPDNLPLDLYGALERAGLEIVEYPAGDREARRRMTLETVKGDQDVLFSLKREDSQKVFDTAKRKFGETKDIREAGYVLPDGSMLDFSGRHELDPGTDSSFLAGRRTTDHRAINQISFVYDENGDEVDTGVTSDMPDFIKRGAIRIDNNAGSINLSAAPTMAQRRVLRELIRRNGGDVQVDFGDGWNSDHYVEYEEASAQRVLGDIDRYFDEGIKPEGNVRFSLKKETRTDADGNKVYTETREDGTKDREITTYGDGSKKALWYDDKGNLKERLDYFPNGEVSQVVNYDNDGNLTRNIQYDENRRTTSYYLPAIGTDWKLDENGIARGKSNGVEIKPYNFQFSLKRNTAELDKEYVDAIKRGDEQRAIEMLLNKALSAEGITPYIAPHGYGGSHRDIAKRLKTNEGNAVVRAVADMQRFIPDNAVLVPMPPHEGEVTEETDTMILADALSVITGKPVVVALEGEPRESRYAAKAAGRPGITAEEMGFRKIADIPEGKVPIIIDNVVGTGETAKAAVNALGGGITLAYAKATRSKATEGLKNATITYDDEGNLIPLSQRFDLSKDDVRYSLKRDTQTHSENFKRWFGDWENDPENASKVVDAEGKPLVVYRGGNKISIFDPDKASKMAMYGPAFYATPSYADAQGFGKERTGNADNVLAVYLDIRNPWVDGPCESFGYPKEATMEQARELVDLLTSKGLVDGGIILAKWNDGRVRSLLGALADAEYEGVERGRGEWWHASAIVQDALKELGYDGVVGRFDIGDGHMVEQVAAFEPTQIKSATENNGDFSRENPDIRFSLKRRRNRDDYTDEDRADAAIIANTYLAQADALRQQIEADRQREHQLVEERNKLLAFDYPAADPADRPAIMDRINDLRNQINDLRNANYENNTKLRSMDYEYRVAKEILEQDAVTDEEAAHFDAGQQTREEKVLESLFKAVADNKADKKAKQKAIRGLVRELAAITGNFKAAMKARGIESQRKHYDKGTVDHIIRLAKAMMGTGYIDNMTSYEVKRLMGMINNAATRESIEEQAGRIVDMMLDHQIRTLRNDFNKQLKVTGQKTNSSGVQVQAGLDQEGQVVMDSYRKSMEIIADSAGKREEKDGELTEWGEFYNKILNDMGDADPVKAEQARKIFTGILLAERWFNDVRAMEINGRILRSQMEDFKASNKPAKDADADTKQRYNDVLADYQEMLRQNKIKIIEAYERMTGEVGMTQAESVRRAKEFAEAQKQRVNEIQHNANSDLEGVDDNTQVKTPESRVFGANKNNVLVRLLFESAGTYEKFMRFFGRMAPNGEGYLFKRFMTQYHHARQNYWKGRHSAFEEMDKKMAEVFGKKKMHWSDIYEMTRDHKKFPPITVSYWDGYRNGQPYLRVDELNQSEALYLYMINKMPDGRMKLRKMGITDDVVQQMAGQIDGRLIQLADWLQSEFLPKMRVKYNETHKRVFGADMAAIEDYFPLRINRLARTSDKDITQRDADDNRPSTITSAIVKRRVNTKPIDLHTDAFDVALSHIDEMEHWAAFAEFNRDNNTLVNYNRFSTKVHNMRSLELGAGDVLWKNFTDAVAIAADAYHPKAGKRGGDYYSTRVAKFVSTAKIALRPYTALKQLLSIPAFWADSDPLEQMKATVNVANTWQWAIENLPGFAERWQSRQAGNIKLANYNDLSGLRRRKAMRKLQRAGMWANAAIDGLACAMGGKAVYETKLKRYRKMGYDETRAQEKALIDAAVAYNNSQQSSEGAYVSPLQVDRTWFANAFSVFRSASMGYTRRFNTSLRQLRNATFKPGYGAQSVEFLKKQMMRDGLTEEQAEKWAHRIYRRANLKAAASVAIFGQILPFTWNLGANMFYLLFGDDDKEKEGILADSFRHSFFGPVEGLTGGNVISELGDIASDTAIGNIWGDSVWGDSEAYKTLGYREFSTMPLSSDLSSLLKYFARDEVKAANEVVNILFQVATGVNPQTITDWATAILDFSRSDMERRDIAMFAMRLLSTPQSQLDKFYLDQMNISQEQADKMSVDDLIKRYATYKRWRETPLTGWMYSDEREKEVEEKFQKRYEEMLEERSVAEDGLRGAINDIKDLPRKRTMMQKLQKELTDSIEAADPELYKKALEGEKADDDEYVRHVTDKDVEQMAELQMKKKALRAARDRKVQADKDAEAGRITQEEYDAIYEVCAHEWKLYNYLNNTLPKKLKEWKLKMEPDMQDKYTPEQVMDTIRSKTDKALQMRPEDMKLKKGDKKKVKKNKKK